MYKKIGRNILCFHGRSSNNGLQFGYPRHMSTRKCEWTTITRHIIQYSLLRAPRLAECCPPGPPPSIAGNLRRPVQKSSYISDSLTHREDTSYWCPERSQADKAPRQSSSSPSGQRQSSFDGRSRYVFLVTLQMTQLLFSVALACFFFRICLDRDCSVAKHGALHFAGLESALAALSLTDFFSLIRNNMKMLYALLTVLFECLHFTCLN